MDVKINIEHTLLPVVHLIRNSLTISRHSFLAVGGVVPTAEGWRLWHTGLPVVQRVLCHEVGVITISHKVVESKSSNYNLRLSSFLSI